jgi:hypothetical protein
MEAVVLIQREDPTAAHCIWSARQVGQIRQQVHTAARPGGRWIAWSIS